MSLDLIETLLNLAESGHFEEAHQLFGFPLKHCPDILLFGVLQSKVYTPCGVCVGGGGMRSGCVCRVEWVCM